MLTNTNTHAGAQQALFDRALLEILLVGIIPIIPISLTS